MRQKKDSVSAKGHQNRPSNGGDMAVFLNGPWMAPLFSEAFFRKIAISPPFKGRF